MTTFTVIHGAGDSGANWEPVGAELRARGHEMIAPDLPCEDPAAGLREYTETVVDAIGERSEIVLVAHSLGGFTAPLVAARVPVEKIVLIAAMVPSPGETGIEWWANTGHSDEVQPWPDDERELFLQDAPADVAVATLARSRTQTRRVMDEPWPLDAWPDVPTRVLVGRDDRLFPADFQRRVARERLGIEADEIDGGHLLALSEPELVVERFEAYRTAGSIP
jgi:pimeloyl-ACP methyl ester carboxylesterase